MLRFAGSEPPPPLLPLTHPHQQCGGNGIHTVFIVKQIVYITRYLFLMNACLPVANLDSWICKPDLTHCSRYSVEATVHKIFIVKQIVFYVIRYLLC
jgi:hypothetical protein